MLKGHICKEIFTVFTTIIFLNRFTFSINFWVQIREAIGVAMCVTCSNMRLSGSFGPGSREELCGDVSMIEQTGNEYWSKCLTDGANELAVSIQNSIQSKQLGSTSDSATENSMDHREESDAKRMETVLIFYLSPSLRFHIHLFHFCLTSLCFFLCRFFIS